MSVLGKSNKMDLLVCPTIVLRNENGKFILAPTVYSMSDFTFVVRVQNYITFADFSTNH